ncbi:MAG: hypothetical protein WBP93_04400, partial [Pyrinomonadaceae bacterium]
RWAASHYTSVELNGEKQGKAKSRVEGARREGGPTTHSTRLLDSNSFIIESFDLVECCSLAAGQFGR